jgi:hypothetical protein
MGGATITVAAAGRLGGGGGIAPAAAAVPSPSLAAPGTGRPGATAQLGMGTPQTQP